MPNGLLWIALSGTILFSLMGLLTLWAHAAKKESLRNADLCAITLLGPISLGICWIVQMQLMKDHTVFWGRLMSGDASKVWAIGSLGLIAGTGFALGALSLQKSSKAAGVFLGSFAMMLSWIVLYLHPTPHYVPMPAWQDKLVWFALLVGGSAVCLIIYIKFHAQLKFLKAPATYIAGIFPLVALGYPLAIGQALTPLDLGQMQPTEQIHTMGCLSCHTMNGVGFSKPGEGLESVASRSEEDVRAFLAAPNSENAKKFGIRANPTGAMAGVHLNESEVNALTDALKTLFALKPPSQMESGSEQVKAILTEKTCLACHTLKGEGAPQGGIGGPLEEGAKLSEETLVEWLKKPSAVNATALKIRETPMGAMESFSLSEEQAKLLAAWLKSLETK